MDYQGKVVIVTGAAKGIGRTVAIKLKQVLFCFFNFFTHFFFVESTIRGRIPFLKPPLADTGGFDIQCVANDLTI